MSATVLIAQFEDSASVAAVAEYVRTVGKQPLSIEHKGPTTTLVQADGSSVVDDVKIVDALVTASAAALSLDAAQLAAVQALAATLPQYASSNKDKLPELLVLLNAKLAGAPASVLDGATALNVADVLLWAAIISNARWPVLVKAGADKTKFAAVGAWVAAVGALPAGTFLLGKLAAKKQEVREQKQEKAKTGSFDIGLEGAEEGKVVTRFPPEPSGYLHIGHAKALFLNHYFATHYKGKMLLRFDDTNPSKEKDEYVANIMQDMKTLGMEWVGPTYTSDYFKLLEQLCEGMIKRGVAYCDNTPVDKMRDERMRLEASACRTNTVEQNLRAWGEMLKGSPEGFTYCVRAMMNPADPVGCMRDAVMYRCNATPHHRTKDAYKAYPTYDFACPVVDSIEGVSHCLRTIEYHDRNQQYSWFCTQLGIREPKIWDYSRLNFVSTLLSKRKLQWFVDQKLVEGWFDPRFPTVQGIMRRGLLVETLKDFMLSQGASRADNLMEWDKIWALNKLKLEVRCPRLNAVATDNVVPFVLVDVQADEVITVPLHLKNPEVGSKAQMRSKVILMDQADAASFKDGEEITLMSWGNAFVDTIERDPVTGVVTKLTGRTNVNGDFKKTDKKVQWVGYVDKAELVPLTLVEYGHLITVPKLEEDQAVQDVVNHNSKKVTQALGEQALRIYKVDDIVQLQRKGFYRVDAVPSAANPSYTLIFIPDGRKEKGAEASAAAAAAAAPKAKGPAAAAAGGAPAAPKPLSKKEKARALAADKAAASADSNQPSASPTTDNATA